MLRKVRLLLAVMLITVSASAQVTTSSIGGKITDTSNEPIIGATIKVIHEPSGTSYSAITNVDGRYSIQSMRAGGPYKMDISYVGYQTVVFKGINLSLGESYVQNAYLKESNELLDEVVVTASKSSNMKSDRAGAITNINSERIATIPTVSRSLNDVMRLSPQSATTSNGFAVGGGNYRQSYITVDGAAFNNSFGIGSNLPAGGSPISLDALEQMTVSVTPYDVRQSGFTGGSINAVTKSGTNQFKGSAYSFLTNNDLIGDKVGDSKLNLSKSHDYTYGATLGGAIIKNKLFFFLNGEYQDVLSAGPTARAREDASEAISSIAHRPLKSEMDNIRQYLIDTYKYDPGKYQGYNANAPTYRFLARIDWNINENNKLNFRFSKTKNKYTSAPSPSTNPWNATLIFPGSTSTSPVTGSGQTASSNYGLYFYNSRYYQEQNFSSLASEWASKWGRVNNTLRLTYSYQNEPRSTDGGAFPTTYILKDGAVFAQFGTEFFTAGNLRQVKTFVATDEANWTLGDHSLMAGLQFESNSALNGYMQGGNGAYVFNSWADFTSGAKPSAFLITHSNSSDLSQFQAKMKTMQYSAYIQDQWNVNNNFKLTAGLRFELPVYPSLNNNYNKAFAALKFGDRQFSTDQVPNNSISISPRVGFNWDITGERKYVLRGGTGYFVGRMPFVWLVSAVGNSNVGQTQYFYNKAASATGAQPSFHTNVNDILKDLYPNGFNPQDLTAPPSPTIIDKDLKMPATWKTSLAFDAKLPGDVDFTLEGIYNRDFGPAVISNANVYADGTKTFSANDTRTKYSKYNANNNAFLIENGGNKAYYYSITTQLHKAFDFGLDLSFAYTHSKSRSYGDGIGDQVTSAYYTNLFAVNGVNDHALGYGTYVASNRILASVGYSIAYAKNLKSSFSFIYEGMPMGYVGTYSYSRYSYSYSTNIVGDGGANNLMYIPASKDELTFRDVTDKSSGKVTYSATDQKNDFWNYVMQDKYLKNHLGQYAERGGAEMPWHHQVDFKFNQDFYMSVGGKKNTLQLGVDIQNLGNLLNSKWGLYKQMNSGAANSVAPLAYNGDGTYTMLKVNDQVLKNTYTNYNATASTYRVMFSVRYIFN